MTDDNDDEKGVSLSFVFCLLSSVFRLPKCWSLGAESNRRYLIHIQAFWPLNYRRERFS